VADLELGMKLQPQDPLMRQLRDAMQAKLGSTAAPPALKPAT
jgi:hypothetical protein